MTVIDLNAFRMEAPSTPENDRRFADRISSQFFRLLRVVALMSNEYGGPEHMRLFLRLVVRTASDLIEQKYGREERDDALSAIDRPRH